MVMNNIFKQRQNNVIVLHSTVMICSDFVFKHIKYSLWLFTSN